MVKSKSNNVVYIFVIIILTVILVHVIYCHINREGFYVNDSTTQAKNTVDTFLGEKLDSITTILKDINSNRYNLDIMSAITDLSTDLPNVSFNTQSYIAERKNELSNIQSNLNKINQVLLTSIANTQVNQIAPITSSNTETKVMPIIDALNLCSDSLKTISKKLSEIPEN